MKNILFTIGLTAAALAAGFPGKPTLTSIPETIYEYQLPAVEIRPARPCEALPEILLPEVTIYYQPVMQYRATLPEVVIEGRRKSA